MKKTLALTISSMMAAALAVSASAAFVPNNTDVSQIAYTIPQAYAEHKLDGIISEGEYQEIVFSTNELSFAAYSDEAIEASAANPISLHMSYDANYVYIAATSTAKDFHNGCDDNMGNLWGQFGLQLSFADVDDDDASSRLETGYALSSETGALIFSNWNDGMGEAYNALETNDFIVVNNGDTLVYEVRVPYAAFTAKSMAEGGAFRFSIVWATGTSEGDATDQYIHEQLAYGITGDPGKDVTGHATITLGAALEAPPAPIEDEPAEDLEPTINGDETTTPVTADAGIVAAAAMMAAAAGIILSKKR